MVDTCSVIIYLTIYLDSKWVNIVFIIDPCQGRALKKFNLGQCKDRIREENRNRNYQYKKKPAKLK